MQLELKMYQIKLTSFLMLLISTSYTANCAPNHEEYKDINCAIQRKCSTKEDTVWATDNKQCYLFRNPCMFANEMCHRREKQLDELKVATEDECKKYCPDICTDEYVPVCGEYDNAYKNFASECDFYTQSCQNNKSYIFVQNGECPQAAVA